MPWDPGLLAFVPSGYAAFLAFEGVDRDSIYADLRERFPEITPQLAGQLADQAGRVRGILDAFENALPYQQIPRVNIPRNPDLTSAYRFTATVTVFDPDSGELVTRNVVLDESSNLTRQELEDRLRAVFEEEFVDKPGSPGQEQISEQFQFRYFTLITVERRT